MSPEKSRKRIKITLAGTIINNNISRKQAIIVLLVMLQMARTAMLEALSKMKAINRRNTSRSISKVTKNIKE